MKNIIFTLVALVGTASLYAKDIKLETQKDKVSYIIGRDIGQNFKSQEMELNFEIFFKGIKESFAGDKSQINEVDTKKIMMEFSKVMRAKHESRIKKVTSKNIEAGKAFLAKNKLRKGVKVTASGLQYEIIRAGTGKIPKATDTVETHYKGTLLDGTVFDSSYKRGKTVSFPVKGVIKGWTEALQLMKTGAKWKLFIPSDLAYGVRGAGAKIGPNSTLIFEIELVAIK